MNADRTPQTLVLASQGRTSGSIATARARACVAAVIAAVGLALAPGCPTPTDPNPLPITETGNPERSLGVAAVPPPSTPPIGTELTGAITSAWAGFNGTRLILDEAYAGANELEWETPELVTDLAGTVVDLTFASPDAVYNRVEIRPRRGRDAPPQAPPELHDASFVVDGARSDGVAFRIVSDTDDEIVLAGGFELVHTQKSLALGFDLDTWLDGIDLAGLDVGGDGTILVDSGSNQAALAAFEANLGSSARLVDDLNDDGVADPGEPVLAQP